MEAKQQKLFATAILLMLAIIMLVGASFAWMTISTNPEIKGFQLSLNTNQTLLVGKTQTGEFHQLLDIGENLKNFVELKPVSTIDGVNWFLPTYNLDGSLKDPSEFILDDTLAHANVLKVNSKGVLLSEAALQAAREKGYYIYTEFWLKTEEEACNVRLSVPSLGQLDDWEIKQGLYGTYVLSKYQIVGEGLAVMDIGAQAALRVGFLTNPDSSIRREFYIYEPNADQRSDSNKPSTMEQYVVGYNKNADNSNYMENYYIPTRPIAKGSDGKGKIADIDNSKLMIQKQSFWDMNALNKAYGEKKDLSKWSNYVETMGRFVANNRLLLEAEQENGMYPMTKANEAVAGETVILRLEKNQPQKVRLFIWIEGQDVDCWNDIAIGSLAINLELAGESIILDSNDKNP